MHETAVRPCRYYLQKVGSSGLLAYAIATQPPRGPALNDLMAKGEVITEDEVKDKSRAFGINLAGDDLREVVEALNLMRVTVHAEDALSPILKPYENDIKSVEKCINELSRKLPRVIEAHLKVDTERAVVSAACFNAQLQATRAYLRDRWALFGGRPPPWRHEPWHGDAICLMGLCNIACGKPGLLSGVNPTSPVVKLIVWAFDRIGNKPRKPEAIAQALNRRNRPAE